MIVKEFAAFATGSRAAPLPDVVYDAATRALVDWYAATVAGSAMRPAVLLRRALDLPDTGASAEAGRGGARLVPDGAPADSRAAALVNGTASHTAEMDDIFREGIYHPGSPTVAAVLAAAQRYHAGGERLLRAIAVGYEIGDRIAAAMQPAHYRYWHTTGTIGALGAAAGVAELLELDTERFAHAVATATTSAAGLQQAFRSDSMSKPLHAGNAAAAGLVAALAAAEGFTGALEVLDGPVGFGVAMSDGPDWQAAVAALGKPWAVTRATVKNHACCGHTFAAVDAALELRAGGLDAATVTSVEVETYTTATEVAHYTDPRTPFEARFSIAYCVAAALWLGRVRLAAFTPEQVADPGLRELASRVTVRPAADLDADFPGRRRARLIVRLADGTQVSRSRDTRKGDPDDPVTDDELSDKFDDLTVPVLGETQARVLGESLWAARSAADVAEAFGAQAAAEVR